MLYASINLMTSYINTFFMSISSEGIWSSSWVMQKGNVFNPTYYYYFGGHHNVDIFTQQPTEKGWMCFQSSLLSWEGAARGFHLNGSACWPSSYVMFRSVFVSSIHILLRAGLASEALVILLIPTGARLPLDKRLNNRLSVQHLAWSGPLTKWNISFTLTASRTSFTDHYL